MNKLTCILITLGITLGLMIIQVAVIVAPRPGAAYGLETKAAADPAPYSPKHIAVITIHTNIIDTPAPTAISSTPEPTATYTPEYNQAPAPTAVESGPVMCGADPCAIVRLSRPQLLNREEVKTFMLYDQTDLNEYTESFRCGEFSSSVKANADRWNEECHMVSVEFSFGWHSILRFPTIEDGDIYVDATMGDWFCNVEYGEGKYYTVSMTDPNRYGFYNATLLGVWEDFR